MTMQISGVPNITPPKPVEQLSKPALEVAAPVEAKVESTGTSDYVAASSKSDAGTDAKNASDLTAQEKMANIKKSEAQAKAEKEGLTESAVKDLNNTAVENDSRLEFTIDEDSGKRMFTIKDRDTGEVLNQYPSEPALKIARVMVEIKEQMEQGESLVNEVT